MVLRSECKDMKIFFYSQTKAKNISYDTLFVGENVCFDFLFQHFFANYLVV